ncbi:MAG: ABC transporter substrate-binding protein [Acidimicrobiia bacterium]
MGAARTRPVVRWASLFAVLALVTAACDGSADVTTTVSQPTTTTSAPTTTTTQPPECPDAFCVRYHIHPDAAWADGTPVTSEDFAFTVDTITDADLDITSSTRAGYDRIIGYELVDDKTFLAIFSEIYAPWKNLFEVVLPAHELEGKPFETVWDDGITLGSGPFVFSEWVPGERIVLTRNPNYWASRDRASGGALGDVQTVNIDVIPGTEAQVRALRNEEIDMFYPEPQISLVEDVTSMSDVTSEAGLGRIWEQIDFNHDDPLLSQEFIRRTFAMAIDRNAVMEEVVRPMAPDAVPLGNTVWMVGTPYYQDHFSQFSFDPVGAEQLLIENGCVKGEDAIYVCQGQRLSFRWATTAGIEGRETLFDLAQASLTEIGIEVTADFGPATRVFANEFIYGDSSVWQILNFAWVGAPDPHGRNTVYYCEGAAPSGFGDLNVNRYCNDEVESLIRQTEVEVDQSARAELYNQADSIYLGDVASIPLYQKPTFFAWNELITGPRDNPTQTGPFWNIATWSGKEEVIFAVDQEPDSWNTFEPAGGLFAVDLVTTAVLEGAFTVAPDYTYVPQLIESYEVIISEG